MNRTEIDRSEDSGADAVRTARCFAVMAGVVLVLSLVAREAGAEDPKVAAQKAIARAKEHHKAGHDAEALQELSLAYALDPQKDLLYGIAQLHVKLGHCPEAITFYQKYLASKPDADSASKAQQAIIACYEKKSAEPPANPTTPPKNPTTNPLINPTNPPTNPAHPNPGNPQAGSPSSGQPLPVELEAVRRPFYRDVIGDVLVGTGTVAVIAGVVIYAGARSTRTDADNAATYPEFEAKLDDARHARNVSLLVGGIGAALVVGGIMKFSTNKPRHEHRLTVVPARSGGAAVWSGRF